MNSNQTFLDAILQKPTDTVTKLVYADWLDGQGDLRGEYLRLLVEFDETQEVERRQLLREQLFQLRDDLPSDWTQTIDRTRILTDGFYRNVDEKHPDIHGDYFSDWLRFYSDGTLMMIMCGGTPSHGWEEVERLTEELRDELVHFDLRVDELEFKFEEADTDYWAVVADPWRFTLESYFHPNGRTYRDIYQFVERPA